ncbi:hypothetical protein GOL97_26125 [Sinorhizobium medicae]|uniref:hypothetical protein n=1 Tax=Sinorhizobium medicae TaxID=110321 RepID=UPI001295FE3E|nr:hypothetical protein [Sinorhizobium medicae]MDX0487531.1 hypothetical protein [Sinorhizobium medicae]MDX0498976.1 hypothetical protein [Sinorhizobium medicae]MDX0530707.1 hypothetical protein [Sinorhizobium medicae]MDX1206771.1 hypothetical protein [Sinorhizobium medicae]MQV96769.1 hypothetical protein [Sinorhizobium medicae]
MIDAKALGLELAVIVKAQLDPMAARIAELEKRLAEAEARSAPVSVAGALIDRTGSLVLTMSDGTTKDLGPIVGRDGDPGKDGLGFDDLDVSYDGEKTITLKFTQGERVKEFAFTMPVVIDRGVYRDGSEYKAGDGVTWGGSFWIAQKDTSAKPDAGDDWRLSVKRGRDGKHGEMKQAKAHSPVRVGVPAAKEA